MKPRGPSRRDVLRAAGAGAAVLVAHGAGCGDNATSRAPGDHHASAILETGPDSFVVTLWSPVAVAAAIEVRSGDTVVHTMRVVLDGARFADEPA